MSTIDTFWKIEQATGNGYYITHDGSYSTRKAAEHEAARHPNARAVLYQTGTGNGPVRAHETA